MSLHSHLNLGGDASHLGSSDLFLIVLSSQNHGMSLSSDLFVLIYHEVTFSFENPINWKLSFLSLWVWWSLSPDWRNWNYPDSCWSLNVYFQELNWGGTYFQELNWRGTYFQELNWGGTCLAHGTITLSNIWAGNTKSIKGLEKSLTPFVTGISPHLIWSIWSPEAQMVHSLQCDPREPQIYVCLVDGLSTSRKYSSPSILQSMD